MAAKFGNKCKKSCKGDQGGANGGDGNGNDGGDATNCDILVQDRAPRRPPKPQLQSKGGNFSEKFTTRR